MYTVTKLLNGKFLCEVRMQSDIDRWEDPNLEIAIAKVKKAAPVCNGVKIKKKDIHFLEERQVVEIKRFKWDPYAS